MMTINPFADDSKSVSIGGLTIENGTDRIALYGSLDVTRDRDGLARAQALQAILAAAIQALSALPDLPQTAAPPAPAKSVRNPFA